MANSHSSAGKGNVATVLVPTDFSAESLKALRYGAAVARKFRAQLHILHVSEIDYAIPGPAQPGADPFTSNTEEARQLKQQLASEIGDSTTPTFHGRTGRAFDQICRAARELKADLIVMATHGRTGLKRFVLGSNAERVVQHSSSPVLIVREHERELLTDGQQLRLHTMLVPTDFSDSSREALSYALTLARQFNARLIIFHSFAIRDFTPTELGAQRPAPGPEALQTAAEDQLRSFVEGIDFGGVEFETQVRPGSAAEGICEQAEKQKADLIVISTHGRTGLLHVLIGSVAEHVVRYAHVPVLVVPTRPELQPKAP